ncbi:MAG: cofactor-independent phosphoglycerate mutase [Candidatus Omnitrophica bacterium]|nr:cofactor-independent phosphoglycerate mutase [Candidatus Omnitrophota bacterium]
MKYLVIIPDGIGDRPTEALGGKTPLEVARHPHMDAIAQQGITGWAHTIPSGFAPGSDVGCMSVFGYDPRKHHTGRAPLEAAAQGIILKDADVAFRCNTLTVSDGVMIDHSADHITTEESSQLIQAVNEKLASKEMRFYPGVSYRHILVAQGEAFSQTRCTPPHDILDRPIASFLPSGPGSELLKKLMQESVELLKDHSVNKKRMAAGKRPANMLWFWGQGKATNLPPFQKTYGLKAACISAVDIVRGIGVLAGFQILKVPGITGYFDTNYKGKAEYALKALNEGFDLVLIHVESTDEAGHMGDAKKKIQAIEDVDRLIVGPVLQQLQQEGGPFSILIVCDHPTSTALKTHIAKPVPFALYTQGGPRDEVAAFHESAIANSTVQFTEGFELMGYFLQRTR